MRCEEVQELLSEYLEKLLDPGQSRIVDGHLASCPRCTGELAELAECRRLVAGLAVVDPPVGFTTRIMAHVSEGAEKPFWWRRLFFPLPTKLPLSAAALLVISVMSVYLLQKEKPQENLIPSLALQSETEAPKTTRQAAQQLAADSNSSVPEMINTAPANESKTMALPQATQPMLSADAKQAAARSAVPSLDRKISTAGRPAKLEARTDSTPAAAPKSLADERAASVESRPAEAELPPTPSRPIAGAIGVSQPAGGRGAPASPSMDAIMQERAMRAPLPERARSTSPSPGQPTADIEFVIRRHPQPANEQQDSSEPLRKEIERKLGAPNLSAPTMPRVAPTPAQSEPVFRTISVDQYEQFKKELAVQGTIISEVRTGTRDGDGPSMANQTLTIKVTVLPAEVAR